MHRRDASTRRRFLRLAGSAAAIGAMPIVSVRPVEATPEMMVDCGPEELFREALALVRAETGLTEEERKNS